MEVSPQPYSALRSNLEGVAIGIRASYFGFSDTIMSDSEDSTVTYTEVSSPFEGLSKIGFPGVVGPEYEGLPLDAR
ncbi:hypothetical protein Tco_0359553 [Tanacetum coccineum]